MIFGVVLLTQIYDVGVSGVTAVGVGAGLLAGLSYAIFVFGFKYAAPRAILSIALTVLATILIWPSDVGQTLVILSTPDWPLLQYSVCSAQVCLFLFFISSA